MNFLGGMNTSDFTKYMYLDVYTSDFAKYKYLDVYCVFAKHFIYRSQRHRQI